MHPTSSARPTASALATPHLRLPTTGQALRQALAQRDTALLMRLSAQLRVLGCRTQPEALVEQLLTHGCARVQDAFGHDVLLDVAVPSPQPRQRPNPAQAFRISV